VKALWSFFKCSFFARRILLADDSIVSGSMVKNPTKKTKINAEGKNANPVNKPLPWVPHSWVMQLVLGTTFIFFFSTLGRFIDKNPGKFAGQVR
jgi:hypothetical protein